MSVESEVPRSDGGPGSSALLLDTVEGARLLPGSLRPVWPGARLHGPAFPLHQSPGGNLWLHRAIEAAPPGSVLVMAGGDARHGYWGELMTRAALGRGLAGLVIDGGVRDVEAIEALKFPVWAAAVCARGSGKDPTLAGSLGEPVLLGDVRIRKGDLVVGDRDGLVGIPRAERPRIEERVRAGEVRERETAEALAAGARLLDRVPEYEGEPTLLERLERLDTCAVSDVMDRLGVGGATGGLRRWGARRRVAGQVRTVALAPGPAPDGPRHHLGTRTLSSAEPGTVIVVANQGRTEAGSWGGLLCLQALIQGVRGIVVDGLLRDADDVDGMELCVLARGSTPRTARGRFHESAIDVPVAFGGLPVQPGSLILADGSGVAFIPAEDAVRVVESAEAVAAREAEMVAALLRGDAGETVMGAEYEAMLREPGAGQRNPGRRRDP